MIAAAPLVMFVMLVAFTTACGSSPGVESSASPTLPPSGVAGVVVLYPTCPVESAPAEGHEDPCRAVPTEATVRVSDASDAVVATTRTGHDGRFRVSLKPGEYTVLATAGSIGCHPIDVAVRPGAFTDVTVRCDTGIR